MDVDMSLLVSQPSLSARPTREPVSVSYSELLLGNAEEFWCVCDHGLGAFVQISTLSPSDFQGQSTAPQRDYVHLRGDAPKNNTYVKL